MLRINPVTVTTILFLLSLSCGCFTQRQPEAAARTTTTDNSTPEGAGTTTPRQSSEHNQGVIGTTGKAIGDIVLFPFRAVGQGLTPGQTQ
ncbi:MAG: hypothetical protein JO166_18765 [Deltaproteobacteria bacterium]|nr:hypothetical protein [Deltaproteobacteria bacterium]